MPVVPILTAGGQTFGFLGPSCCFLKQIGSGDSVAELMLSLLVFAGLAYRLSASAALLVKALRHFRDGMIGSLTVNT